jgi:Ca-activated chloride channel family protein
VPAAQQPPPPDDSYRYRVQVGLVMVAASVTTPEGRPVTDLDQGAFQIYEDGVLRPLKVFERKTGQPLQLVLMVDASLSTASELKGEKLAITRFIQRVLRPQDAAALYEFSGGARARVDFSNDARKLEAGLALIVPRAGTALFDAIVEASEKLKSRDGRRVLVLVTDGSDTTSEKTYHDALRAAQETEVTIFSLVIRPIPGESGRSVAGEHRLINFAEMTGGRVFFPAHAAEMDRFFDELSDLLRTQYWLGYEPAAPEWRARLRTIEVRVPGAEVVVRHRKGYYAEARR